MSGIHAPVTGAGTRILLVGAGSVAHRHAEVLTTLGALVAAVADPAESAARDLAGACGAEGFASADAALAVVDVDAVYVCVPPYAHGAAERAALARGLPLFVEKPLAVDLTTAEELAREIASSGVITGTGYHWRCLDVLARARRLLADAPAVIATGTWMGATPPVAWWSSRSLGGGQVVEQLTHVLDLARQLLGEPVEVHATAVRRAPDVDAVEDATAATVRFVSGAVATFATSRVLDVRHDASLRVVAPGVAMTITEEALVVERGSGQQTFPVREDPRVAVDRDFLGALRSGRAAVAPYVDALESHRLACAIADSARTGSVIRLADPPDPSRRASS